MKNRIAVGKAEEVARQHGRNPFEVARRLGFRLFYEDLPEGCDEMVLPDLKLMFLRPEYRDNEPRARVLVAHALGHVFLHTGDQVRCDLGRHWFVRHEKQADAFGLTLLHGPRVGEAV